MTVLSTQVRQIPEHKLHPASALYPKQPSISVAELKNKVLAAEKIHYIWLTACPKANRTTSVLKWYQLDADWTCHQLAPYCENSNDWVFAADDDYFSPGTKFTDSFPAQYQHAFQPFLYSEEEQRVIESESYAISLKIAAAMDELAAIPEANSLFPASHRPELRQWNAWLFTHVNGPIYTVQRNDAGEKRNQGMRQLEADYALLNDHFSDQDYLVNNQLTESDLRLFNNLYRHEIYRHQFKIFAFPLSKYPALVAYVQRILKYPAVQETTFPEIIRATHFRSPHNIKRHGFVKTPPTIADLFPY